MIPWRDPALPGSPPDRTVAFLKRLGELEREVQGAARTLKETAGQLAAMRETVMRATPEEMELYDRVVALETRLADLDLRLSGDPNRSRTGSGGPIPITRRVAVATSGNSYSLYGPTPTHLRSVEIATEQFATWQQEMDKLVDVDLPALRGEFDAAGVPWTPGR